MRPRVRLLVLVACMAGGAAAGCAVGTSDRSGEAASRSTRSSAAAADGWTTYVLTAPGTTTKCVRSPNAEICRSGPIAGIREPIPRGAPRIRGPVVVRATVVEWNDDKGWGVLRAPAVAPGGVWVHFSRIEMNSYKSLVPGRAVRAAVIGPLPYSQEGYRYEATSVRALP